MASGFIKAWLTAGVLDAAYATFVSGLRGTPPAKVWAGVDRANRAFGALARPASLI